MLYRLLPLLVGAAMGPLGGFGIVTLIPTMAAQWSVSFSTAAIAISFYMIPFIGIQIFSGAIAQLFSARRAILFGFSTYAVGALICAMASNLPMLLAARVCQGVGAAFLTPIIMALIGELVPAHHVGKAIGMLGVAYTVGVTLGPLIAGLMEVGFGWPSFFYFMAGLSAATGLLFVVTVKLPAALPGGQNGLLAIFPVLRQALKQPSVLRRSFAAFFLFLAYIGVMTFTADHLKSELAMTSDRVGTLLSVTGFSGIFVSPIAGYLGDRFGREVVFLSGAAFVLLAVAGMIVVPFDYSVHIVLFLCLGTGAATCWTSLNTMAVQISANWRQPVTSVYNAIKFSGYASAPIVLAPIYAPFHLKAVLVTCLGSVILSAWLTATGTRPRRCGFPDVKQRLSGR